MRNCHDCEYYESFEDNRWRCNKEYMRMEEVCLLRAMVVNTKDWKKGYGEDAG